MPRHSYLCAPRWADMDRFGHVNNTQFLAYLEQARVDLFFHGAGQAGVSTMSEGTVVARHEIDYLRPVRYQHRPLRVDLWCSRIAGASFTVDYEIFDGGDDGAERLVARARSLLVPYDLTAGRPRRLTPQEREFLERYRPDPLA
ncbi:MAG TPA: thioesterase family protein [Mycobacteriales bacterium]|nr:thioesterase family protein [Mycobacteriales bacterium]